MSEADDDDKKYDPTPQRREQFRKEGRFAKARDAGGIAATAAVLALLLGSRPVLSHAASALFASYHGNLNGMAFEGAGRIFSAAGGSYLAMAAPAMLGAAVAAVTVGLAQSGLELRTETLGFNFDRLNPLNGLKQLFSMKHHASEVLLGLARVGVVAWVAWRALYGELPALLNLARVTPDASLARSVEAIVRVTLHALLALSIIAAADYGWSWWQLEQEMKMTRREMIDESKAQEGDPKLKGRIRARARAMIKKRSLANVKKADVVVTNPTHIAVALRYAASDPAPVVVAKGHDDLAMLIRAEARKHGIPILENKPLARALDAEVPLGQMVPGKHFAAVARVLAWVYRVKPSARRVKSARR